MFVVIVDRFDVGQRAVRVIDVVFDERVALFAVILVDVLHDLGRVVGIRPSLEGARLGAVGSVITERDPCRAHPTVRVGPEIAGALANHDLPTDRTARVDRHAVIEPIFDPGIDEHLACPHDSLQKSQQLDIVGDHRRARKSARSA